MIYNAQKVFVGSLLQFIEDIDMNVLELYIIHVLLSPVNLYNF